MKASNPCDICGCTEVNLHDGFYYCMECGTQDKNFQETAVEAVEDGEGGLLHTHKKKVVQIVEQEKEMPDTWYKWHAFNFMLKGIADELMVYGAKPTFKTKLLWIWTRFIKHYIKKKEMGFDENTNEKNENNIFLDEEDDISEEDRPPEDIFAVYDKKRDGLIKEFTFTLLISLVYIALNLDKSPIHLSYLVKLCRDGVLSLPYRLEDMVPEELKPGKLRKHICRAMATFRAASIRVRAMTIMKRLDLGSPVVPDLRQILDEFLKELCLPTDLKPLVLSLMHYRPCSFLDVNSNDKLVIRIPAYELHVMTYIIWAMKLCLGLDCDYEVRLSEAAEAINAQENRPKSHIDINSETTNRLFSYREWVSYYQFRIIALRHYCFRYADKTAWDTDDFIALEHQWSEMDYVYNKDFRDEMTMDLLNRIKGGDIISDVIPRSEFPPTLTPFYDYTKVILQHIRDPEVRLKLSEDFSQYSLKYATEDLELVHPEAQKRRNLVKGIRENNKVVTNAFVEYAYYNKYPQNMVYAKNCDNHNWLTTNPPKTEHVTVVDKLESDDEDDDTVIKDDETSTRINENNTLNGMEVSDKSNEMSDHENGVQISDNNNVSEVKHNTEDVDSKTLESDSFSNGTLSSIRFVNETKLLESNELDQMTDDKITDMNDSIANIKADNINEIKEEAEEVNIFDDDFKFEKKEEMEENMADENDNGVDNENNLNVGNYFQDVPQNSQSNMNVSDYFQDVPRQATRADGTISDVSSADSVNFNEDTFDRAKTIKDIILLTCKKHQLPVPPEYNPKKKKVREMGTFGKALHKIYGKNRIYKPRDFVHEKLMRGAWKSLVSDYQTAMQEDILNQITQKVNEAIQNAQPIGTTDIVDETIDNGPVDDGPMNDIPMDDEPMNETLDASEDINSVNNTQSRLRFDDEDEDMLFSEESDGETHAKELLPEKDPNYDEEVYDTSQLYLKASAPAEDVEMDLDANLSRIVERKIAKDTADPSLLTWTAEKAKDDSEEDEPLSIIREHKLLQEKLKDQERKRLHPFLKEKVENYKYWFRFYKDLNDDNSFKRFGNEINELLPSGLTFLLRECARILDIPASVLYRNLQSFEMTAVEKCKFKLKKEKKHFSLFK